MSATRIWLLWAVFIVLPTSAFAQTVSQTVLSGGALAPGLFLGINTSDGKTNWLSGDGTSLTMRYPGGASTWGSVFITPNLSPDRPGRDLTGFQMLALELNGPMGAVVSVGIKDSKQPDDGSETRIWIQLNGDWQTFQIPLSRFVGANLSSIYVLTEFVFIGSPPQTVSVRSIRFTSAPTRILPQFAFGGGWYSAIYFTNTSPNALSFPVRFITDNGTPLSVPAVGSATTVVLPARGAAVIEAPNTGPLTLGYVAVDLPDAVAAYGVFRQSVQGYPDQEAVVPLSGSSATTCTLAWDDRSVSTAVAVVNPSSQDAVLTVTLRDDFGQLIGASSVALAAGNKVALFLRQMPGLSGMVGKRGSADVSVSQGAAVAVLGLRFNGPAFTSIPTTER
jgi:hypothetical protein